MIETGQHPERGEEGFEEWKGWYFFGDPVPGLPDTWSYRNSADDSA